MILHIVLFLTSLFVLMQAANWLVRGITTVSSYLGWRQFVVAFFVMAVGGAIPNFSIGVSSALHGIPELSFADMIGNNVINMTVVMAAAVLFGGTLVADSRIVQSTTLLTMGVAILPLLLVLDGELGRGDGIALLFVFLAYVSWLYSKRRMFGDEEGQDGDPPIEEFRDFLKGLGLVLVGIALIVFSAEGIVRAATFFTEEFFVSVALFGMLVVGLGNALPELYFAVIAARRKQNWVVLGELLGSVMVPSTLVIGTVAILHPITIPDFSPFAIGRAFLIIAALFFLIFIRTRRQVSRKEALVLLVLYLLFVAVELWRA